MLSATGAQNDGECPVTSGTVTALIPARNEQACLSDTLAALFGQTRRPDRVIVIADNCTDRTEQVARGCGAEVFTTKRNTGKKAGALNQVLNWLLPGMTDNDRLLVQDADTRLAPQFLAAALDVLARKPDVGAVGALFYGEPGYGLLGLFQRNEYLRYSREIYRKHDRVQVLSGTAAVLRPCTLRQVRQARQDGRIPGGNSYYNPSAWTEDNEITLAIKTVGWKMLSPPKCSVITEIMPTLRRLWKQRVRWQRGALEDLRAYGWTMVTRPYFARQALMGLSVLSLSLYLFYSAFLAVTGRFSISLPWLAIGLLFVVERVLTVRRGGWRSMALAALLIPELAYDMFQHVVYVTCVVRSQFRLQHWWV